MRIKGVTDLPWVYLQNSLQNCVLCVCCSDGPAADRDEDDVLATFPGTWYEVVYPVQIHSGEEMLDLDTRDHRTRHKVDTVLVFSDIDRRKTFASCGSSGLFSCLLSDNFSLCMLLL